MSAPKPPTDPSNSAVLQRRAALREMSRLVFRGGLLAAMVFATVCAIALFVPDSNDYAKATVLKHQRLAEFSTRKIVFAGGSNLSFGIDSAMIQRATGCPVINMGMNGHLGAQYILEEIKPTLNPGDIVVVSVEWDAFYQPVDGETSSLFGVVMANPKAYDFLTLRQKLRVLAAMPIIAQQKTLRLMTDNLEWNVQRWVKPTFEVDEKSQRIYWNVVLRLAGNSPEGDLVSHLNVKWPYPLLDGNIRKGAAINPQLLHLMADFAAEMTKRGIMVVVSHTPVVKTFYEQHQTAWNAAHKTIAESPALLVPSPPSGFVYDKEYFFDTAYHLNAAGRALRTQKVIQDLQTRLHEKVQCS